MKRKLKIVAILILFVLLFNICVPTLNVFARSLTEEQIANSVEILLRRATGVTISGNTATITYDGGTATVTANGLQKDVENNWNFGDHYGTMWILYTTDSSVTFNLSSEDGRKIYYWEDGNQGEITNHTYTMNNLQIKSQAHEEYQTEFMFENILGGGNNNGVHVIPGGTLVTGNFNYTNSGADPVDIWLNETEIGVGEPPAATKDYYYVESDGTVNFDFGVFINNRITSIKINNVDYSNQLPTTKEGWLEANQGQIDMIRVTVPFATTYNIVTTTTRDFEPSIGNFLWSYLDEDKDSDNYMGNGKLEFVSLKYQGKVFNSLEELLDLHKPYMDFDMSINGKDEGGAVLPSGAELTVKLIPDAGYQLTEFTCNGQAFETQEQIGCYTFEVPSGNFHWGAKFTKVSDLVRTKSEKVEEGTISLGGAEASMGIGTARLDVSDAEVSSEQKTNFEKAAKDYIVANYLDISLYNTVYKGSSKDSWDTEVKELDNEATISLKLDSSINGEDVIVLHEKHDGTYEALPTQYDSDKQSISYKTKSFSKYAIAIKKVVASDNQLKADNTVPTAKTENTESKVTEKTNNPTTGDNILMVISIFTIASIGAFSTIKFNKKHKIVKH